MTTNTRTLSELQLALEAIFAELRALDLRTADAKAITPMAASLKAAADYQTLVDCEIIRRHENGESVPGAAVKDATTQRKWHDEETTSTLAYEQFGLKAFKLIGPAAMEKLNDAGKALAAVASYKPPAEVKKAVY